MNPYFTVGAPDDENRDSEYWLAVRHSIDCVDDYDAKPTSLSAVGKSLRNLVVELEKQLTDSMKYGKDDTWSGAEATGFVQRWVHELVREIEATHVETIPEIPVGNRPAPLVFDDHTIDEAWVEICSACRFGRYRVRARFEPKYHHKDARNLAELLLELASSKRVSSTPTTIIPIRITSTDCSAI